MSWVAQEITGQLVLPAQAHSVYKPAQRALVGVEDDLTTEQRLDNLMNFLEIQGEVVGKDIRKALKFSASQLDTVIKHGVSKKILSVRMDKHLGRGMRFISIAGDDEQIQDQ